MEENEKKVSSEPKKDKSQTQITTSQKTKVASRSTTAKSKKQNPKKGRASIIILIILIVLISIFLLDVIRKYAVLKSLNNKFVDYALMTNYYEKVTPIKDSPLLSAEVYRTENTVKTIVKTKNGSVTTITSKNAGTKEFYNSTEGKIMRYSDKTNFENVMINIVDYTSDINFLSSVFMKLSSENVDGTDCYVLSSYNNPSFLSSRDSSTDKIYVDKETGLVKQIVSEYEENGEVKQDGSKYEYSFNSVTEADLQAPSDISEYVVKEDKEQNEQQ